MTDDVTTLPSPQNHRWVPTRAGLIGLWRYWDETFTFHRGRLLLRGPNGSGKSMALELLLPFLLDGDSSPARLSSAARSRGSLYERVMAGTTEGAKAGFAWVEFRRGNEVFTVGVRIRASTSTHKTDLDFFTTSQTVGVDLRLLDVQREPLSRKLLIEAIGECGRVHGSATEHRNAVREVLFQGFGASRYDSVITALLALRREKLSQNLDLDKLSEVLSEALPPLDEHDLTAVAEGFERLDRRRAELAALEAELGEVKALADRQRHYARSVVAGVANGVRSAETRRDEVTRSEREKQSDLAAAREEAETLEAEEGAIAARLMRIEAEEGALKDSDAYKAGADLTDLRTSVEHQRRQVDRDREALESAADDERRVASKLEAATTELDQATANEGLAARDLRTAAAPLGAEAMAAEVTASPPDDGEAFIAAWVRNRLGQVEEIGHALDRHRDAVIQRDHAAREVEHGVGRVDQHSVSCEQAGSERDDAVATYVLDTRAWAATCSTVSADRVASILPEPPDDPQGVEAAIVLLRSDLGTEHALARSAVDRARSELVEERTVLVGERAELEQGGVIEPPAPSWRSERGERPGGPLWQLVEIVPGLSPAEIDGLEAALAGAGLLDAWVTPDGLIDLPSGTADILLGSRPAWGRSLADVLTPLTDAAVAGGVIGAVLASVPVAAHAATDDSGDVLVGLDGTFRLGPAGGRGPSRSATLLGAAARERQRLARIAELDELIDDLDARLGENARRATALEASMVAMLAELDAAPDGAPVQAASDKLSAAEVRLAEAQDSLQRLRDGLSAAENDVRDALRTLATLGSRHQLPTSRDALDEIASALNRLAGLAAVWARRAGDAHRAQRSRAEAAEDATRAVGRLEVAHHHLAEAEGELTAIEVRLATLDAMVGMEFREVLERLAGLRSARQAQEELRRSLGKQRPEVERRIGSLEAIVKQASAEREQAEAARAEAHRRFGNAVTDGLAADAGVTITGAFDGLTAILAAARSLSAELDGVAADIAAIDRVSARVEECLHHARAALGGRVDLDRDQREDGWWVLRAAVNGVHRSTAEMRRVIEGQLAEGRDELAADEERLFEQTLAGSVRRALADRIRLANELVDGINEQLASVRTAAGAVEVRLRWDVDPEQPPAVKSARSLLLRDPATITDAERTALQDFVRARIDQARAELEVNAPWDARLRETLDYRRWHRFTLQLGHRDWDGFQPATPRRLQRLSTGERSIALHLPMLASIAAHYAGHDGRPSECPRLILLDELFAGVDTANRAQLFGTFTAWDLDAVVTSDHEWCQYATLDGIAIHHLHPSVGDDPVTSTRFTWDGRERALDPSAA